MFKEFFDKFRTKKVNIQVTNESNKEDSKNDEGNKEGGKNKINYFLKIFKKVIRVISKILTAAIVLIATAHFVPELREIMPNFYDFIELILYLFDKMCQFLMHGL